MALNIKNQAVERLAEEVASMTGETKTEAIRRALEERKQRLSLEGQVNPAERILRIFREEIWPSLPPDQRGRRRSRAEEDEILGFGPEGV